MATVLTAAQQAAQMRQQAIDQNLAARQLCVKQGVDMIQSIFTVTNTAYAVGTPTVLNVPMRNVGLIKRFYVEVAATVQGTTSGPTHTLTTLGVSNFFSNITFTDLSNQTRINTAGWHLTQISSAKRRRPFGAAMTTDTPFGYGNNNTKTISAPASITTTITANNVFGFFEVPLSYSDMDLRGAIYANVTNATMNLQLTVNPSALVASGVDATLAMYQSSSATVATMPSFTVTVYQNYLDQLPIGNNGVIVPLLDLATAYLLNNTPVGGIVANQDNPIQYANFRDFMSTTLIYDNNGTLNINGVDINYFSIQSANFTNIIKYDPTTANFLTRLILEDDCPKGMYYFDHRAKPISTIQYGNMQLIVNPITVSGSGSVFLMGFESLALINQVTQAGSIYGI